VSPSEAFAFLAGSSAFSAAVTALSVWLASWLLPSSPPLLPALLAKPDVLLSLVWTLPLAASLAATLYGCSLGNPELLELKRVLTRSLLPLLRAVPPAGITLVALGAGVSEEALFRGVLLPWGTAQLMGVGWAAAPAFALASLASSICFGSLHAVTRLYFAWATAAGLLFCAQLAVTKSLSACLLTHFIYDVIAMGVLTQLWGERDAALPKPVL
jgi:membrane protease YdiL (CAAX protease family)